MKGKWGVRKRRKQVLKDSLIMQSCKKQIFNQTNLTVITYNQSHALVECVRERVDVLVKRLEMSEVLKFILRKNHHQCTTYLLVRLVDGVHIDGQRVLTVGGISYARSLWEGMRNLLQDWTHEYLDLEWRGTHKLQSSRVRKNVELSELRTVTFGIVLGANVRSFVDGPFIGLPGETFLLKSFALEAFLVESFILETFLVGSSALEAILVKLFALEAILVNSFHLKEDPVKSLRLEVFLFEELLFEALPLKAVLFQTFQTFLIFSLLCDLQGGLLLLGLFKSSLGFKLGQAQLLLLLLFLPSFRQGSFSLSLLLALPL